MREAGETGLTLTVECVASHDLINTSCSIDGRSQEICTYYHPCTSVRNGFKLTNYITIFSGDFPQLVALLQPGGHTLTVTAYSTDGQTASSVIEFTRPALLMATCSVTGTVLSCTTTNEVDSVFCIFDASSGEICSVEFELQDIGIRVGEHTVRIFIRDVFSQQVDVDVSFTIVSDLQIECQELDGGLTGARIDCESSGGIGSVFFTCSLDDGALEGCMYDNNVHSHTMLLSL